jgi:hypothetical protein
MKRHLFVLAITSFLTFIPVTLSAQSRWRQICETPLTLQTRTGVDSNPLRLARPSGATPAAPAAAAEDPGSGGQGETAGSSQADIWATVRPSIAIRCAATPSTTIWGSYAFAAERFRSTTLLNMTAHYADAGATHRFGKSWTGSIFGGYERSTQPDVLGLSSQLTFATFHQERGGFRFSHSDAHGSTFAEYWLQQRQYARVIPTLSAQQSDTLHSIAAGRWWTLGPDSFLGLRLDYRQNRSNDRLFDYREPIVSMSYVRDLGRGLRIEATPRVRWISFTSRPVSSNPARNRSDVIPGLSITARQQLRAGVAVVASYAFDKDFSTEPLRRFNDSRLAIGLDFSFGSHARRNVYSGGEQDERSLRAVQLANRGYEEIRKSNWSEALRLSLEAIRLDPLLPEAHTNAGIAYYKLGRLAEATEEWKKSLALRPDEKIRKLLDQVNKAK